MFLALFELTAKCVTVRPLILTITFRETVKILTNKIITIRKFVLALAMSQGISPLTFITVSVLPFVNTVSTGCVRCPLPNIAIAFLVLPHAIAVLLSFYPLTVIDFAMRPGINTFAAHFSFLVIALVNISVTKLFESQSISLVINPTTFINSLIIVDANTKTFPHACFRIKFSNIITVLVALHSEVFAFLYFFEVKNLRNHFGTANDLFMKNVISFSWFGNSSFYCNFKSLF